MYYLIAVRDLLSAICAGDLYDALDQLEILIEMCEDEILLTEHERETLQDTSDEYTSIILDNE